MIVLDGTTGIVSPSVTGTPVIGGLVSATAVTASGTSVDFTGIPSWVKRITVTLVGVSTNGTSQWLVRLGTASGVVSSGYSGTASLVDSSAVSTAHTAGMGIRSGSASNIVSGIVTVVKNSGNVWALSHTAASTLGASLLGGASVDLGGVLTQIRITTVNGTDTFDAGTINIMYEG